MNSFGNFAEEGEDLDDLEEDDELEETEDDKEHKNKLKEVVETLRSKRAMSAQRPSTIVHVNTGALEVSLLVPIISFSLFLMISLISPSDSLKTNEEAVTKTRRGVKASRVDG
jgi:hypothetical protein